MSILINQIALNSYIPEQGINTAYLKVKNWDDYDFKTLFYLVFFDENGTKHDLGNIKIGYVGQPRVSWTKNALPETFSKLGNDYFSLGQDASYYSMLSDIDEDTRLELLTIFKDTIHDNQIFEQARDEAVFQDSIRRSVSLQSINGQFTRVLNGGAILTPFNFKYLKERTEEYAPVEVACVVNPDRRPDSNMHVLIGRNGVGKTTILNNMVRSLVEDSRSSEFGSFWDSTLNFLGPHRIAEGYFSGVISVSFSIFDPFIPPMNRENSDDGICYSYIGLKKLIPNNHDCEYGIKDVQDFEDELFQSLRLCLSLTNKRQSWLRAIEKLGSDDNFAEMELHRLAENVDDDELERRLRNRYSRMSSGHAVVFYTMTKLVEKIEEKTIVFMDEPESHLHPPLLSAFTRAVSDLLNIRNAVAIIATHSPVLLQEVPRSCVSILTRLRLHAEITRPEIETFGENVGTLTREVFDLEVSRSGFHDILTKSVDSGKTYDEIISDYSGQLGAEARSILKGKIYRRDNRQGADK